MACATPLALEQLLAGELPAGEADVLREHLAGCPACREVANDLSDHAGLRLWAAAGRQLPPVDMGPGVAGLLDRLHVHGAWETPAARAGGSTTGGQCRETPPHPTPEQLGGYRILNELGRGGMGIVFKALDEQLDRVVALKVLRPERSDAASQERFIREARGAATVVHDHVVAVHAVGYLPDGELWLVMEYVDGLTLRQRIEADRRLEPKAAARIASQVADGLAAAHAKGLVHRDIKPSNIILDEAQDRAKIMDFGLVRILDGSAGTTQEGLIAGTPEYMSPEQIRTPQRADTRSDVYGLGVTLYEMLTGEPPFRGAPQMVLDQVLRDEPTAPRRLNDRIPRDLETICLKAIAKEQHRRYQTAGELGDDLARWLAGEPIQARPVGRVEKVWRWCRRNPVPATLTALLATVFLIGFAGTTFGLVQARLALGKADRATQAALSQKMKAESAAAAEAIARAAEARAAQTARAERDWAKENQRMAYAVRVFFQNDLLRQAEPLWQSDRLRELGDEFEFVENPTVKELLDRAAVELTPNKIEAKFPKQPLVQAEILHSVGCAYRGVGEFAKSIAFLRRASEMDARLPRRLDKDRHSWLLDLAAACSNGGKTGEAIRILEQVRDEQLATLGPTHVETLLTLFNLCSRYRIGGRTAEAVELAQRIRDAATATLGAEDPLTISAQKLLAGAYLDAGRIAEAIDLLERVRDARKARYTANHPYMLSALQALADAYCFAGRTDEGIVLYEQVRAGRRLTFSPTHPVTLSTLNALADAYREAGRLAEATALFEEVAAQRSQRLGPTHPDTLITRNNLAICYALDRRFTEAIDLFQQVREDQASQLDADHPALLNTLHNLASTYRANKRLDDAIALFEQVKAARLKKLGPIHPHTLLTLNNLGLAYKEAGQLAKALPLYQKALTGARQSLGMAHPNSQSILRNLCICQEQLQQPDQAEPLRRELALQVKARRGADSFAYADALAALSNNLLSQKKYEDAEPVLRDSVAILQQVRPDEWSTFTTQALLGASLFAQQKYEGAEPVLLQAFAGMQQRADKIPRSAQSLLPNTARRLVSLYEAVGKPDEAAKWRAKLTMIGAPVP